ncbi:MAG: UDP-3-O-[3-hydroxymyristoyl] N-acetylglucosamine deacetylase [Alphaproteobacteria bacterium]|nr:UDP-3-O-[3-hydroxymyristoyl] N-acetylglucosamine deacetylase [Alphaproteobacteria bacterium]
MFRDYDYIDTHADCEIDAVFSSSPDEDAVGVEAVIDNSFVPFKQATLKNEIFCRGVGLHSGKEVTVALKPAPAGTGIIFRRTDVDSNIADIAAVWSNVSDAKLCTKIENDHGVSVATIEHIMAAFSAMSVDNAVVELDNPEVAILDGSAKGYVTLIEDAGIVEQDAPRFAIKILKSLEIDTCGSVVRFDPLQDGDEKGFHLNVDIDFKDAVIGKQSSSIVLNPKDFKKQIAMARTFGFLSDVNKLQAEGLILGGSLDNAIIVDGGEVLNDDGLRCEDEFARHKLLDAIGDISLLGLPVEGKFYGKRSGHYLNNLLLQKLAENRDAWCLVPVGDSSAEQSVDNTVDIAVINDVVGADVSPQVLWAMPSALSASCTR